MIRSYSKKMASTQSTGYLHWLHAASGWCSVRLLGGNIVVLQLLQLLGVLLVVHFLVLGNRVVNVCPGAGRDVPWGSRVERPRGDILLAFAHPCQHFSHQRPRIQSVVCSHSTPPHATNISVVQYQSRKKQTYSGNFKLTCLVLDELMNKFLSAPACSIIWVCRSLRSAQVFLHPS